MTGTGTQADPYIVDSWPDFVTAVGTSGVYVEVVPGTTWNMNDIAPEGVDGVEFYCVYFDGKGITIKNLRLLDRIYHKTSCTVKNMKLLDTLVEKSSLLRTEGNAVTVNYEDCVISTLSSASEAVIKTTEYANKLYFRRCGITVRAEKALFCSNSYGGTQPWFVDSHINYIGYSLTNQHTSYAGIRLQNSFVAGSFGKYCDVHESSNSIINAQGEQVLNVNGTVSNVFVNSDMAESIASSLTSVTDAQMRDAAYLASLGFPIGVSS